MFHLAIATPGRDTGLAVGVAVDEPFLRLKTSVVSVMPELGLVLVIKSTSHRNTWALDRAISVCPERAMFDAVDCKRGLTWWAAQRPTQT